MSRGIPVVVATGNAGKAREFGRLLAPVFEVAGLPDAVTLPEETGDTFAANARSKAEAVFAALGGRQAVLADDSGLEVASLGGRPGVLSARYAGEGARDEENVDRLLGELEGCDDRRARFVCRLCLMVPTAESAASCVEPLVVEVEGRAEGTIVEAPRGALGFGYDPVFLPEGWQVTLAEADPLEKDGVSHRGAAVRALLRQVASLWNGAGT